MTRNIQRYILADPLYILVLNNGTMYGTRGKTNIHALMDHRSSNNTTGNHLRDPLENHKLEIRWSGNLFLNNIPALSCCIYPSWIFHTWKFMREKNLSLEEGTANLQPQRQNNSFIMEDFIEADIDGYIMAELNRFRLTFRANCRSEISTGDGKDISLNTLKGKKNWTLEWYIWPPQPIPHLKSWENWRSDLTSTYNLLITIAPPPSLKLGTCHADKHPTGWV